NLYSVPIFIIAASINALIYTRASCKPCDPRTAIPTNIQYTAFYIFIYPSGIYIGIFLLIKFADRAAYNRILNRYGRKAAPIFFDCRVTKERRKKLIILIFKYFRFFEYVITIRILWELCVGVVANYARGETASKIKSVAETHESLMLLLFPSECAVFSLVYIIYFVANRGRCGNRYRFHKEYERNKDRAWQTPTQETREEGYILRKLWR
ncbi:hypothetical protein PFISCL1PPCAC_9196, partial [Pristionchus fissidentatus]